MIIGAWRSLVAHLHGVQGVGGSNPLAPILPCKLMFNSSSPIVVSIAHAAVICSSHAHNPAKKQGKQRAMGQRKRKLGVASSTNLLDNTLCLFLPGRGETGRSAAW